MLGVTTHPQRREETAVNATLSCPGAGRQAAGDEARRVLAGFPGEFYRCLTERGDALFGLADAVLCEDRRVTDLARLSLAPGFGRGHGALHDGLNAGRAEFARLRVTLARLPLPAWPASRIRLAVDVCNWLRPGAETSPERMFCHVHGWRRNAGQVVSGVAVLVCRRARAGGVVVDAAVGGRLGPDDDEAEVTAAQLREVVTQLAAGRGRDGAPVRHHRPGCRVQRHAAGLAAGGPARGAGRAGAVGPRVIFPPPARLPSARGRNARPGTIDVLPTISKIPAIAARTIPATASAGTPSALDRGAEKARAALSRHASLTNGLQDSALPDTDSPEALSSNILPNIALESGCARSVEAQVRRPVISRAMMVFMISEVPP
jgi:hypothetical protein